MMVALKTFGIWDFQMRDAQLIPSPRNPLVADKYLCSEVGNGVPGIPAAH